MFPVQAKHLLANMLRQSALFFCGATSAAHFHDRAKERKEKEVAGGREAEEVNLKPTAVPFQSETFMNMLDL